VKRVASIVGLRPERQQEYLQLHRNVWPGVESMIRAANITNYSIFLRDGMLFAYYEYVGSDYAADMARIAADPESRRWWQLTDPCQQPLATAEPGEVWVEATEVYRLGES
jgi:L-rhamnose mutarotase